MFQSIIDDVKSTFQSGNMITRLITINLIVFVSLLLLGAFFNHGATVEGGTNVYRFLIDQVLALPGSITDLLFRPWSIITYMFVHIGFWSILWKMLLLYWFGRIVGDLLGDHKILPIYITAGVLGALVFAIVSSLVAGPVSYAYGASAGVMALVAAAGATSPDYSMRLILIGDVRLKYVVLGLLLMSMISGGRAGMILSLTGAIFGFLYVYRLREGYDMAAWVGSIQSYFSAIKEKPKSRSPLKVASKRARKSSSKGNASSDSISHQEKLDYILDKIKDKGFDKLTDEEKEFLYLASKKD